MIPQGALGAAARDSMERQARGPRGSGPSGGKSAAGILSGIAVLLISFWSFTASEGSQLELWQRILGGVGGGFIAYSLGFRARGLSFWIASPAFALLAAWAVHELNSGSGGPAGWFWPAVVLIVILADQLGLNNARAMTDPRQEPRRKSGAAE